MKFLVRKRAYPFSAIKTGLFDFVWVQYPTTIRPVCMQMETSTISGIILGTWWTGFPVEKLYMGRQAASAASPSGGFTPANVLKSQVLPTFHGKYI